MNRQYVLFAPVGTTDPVGSCYDGPIMHIVRNYRDKGLLQVRLFITAEMVEREANVIKAVRRLAPQCEVISHVYPEITDPSDFEIFLSIYRKELEKIRADFPDAFILLNVTSGTPQMVASLCMLGSSGIFSNILPVQVKTPARKSNARPYEPEKDEDDIQCNKNDEPDAESRSLNLDLNSFRKGMAPEQIRAALTSYDYVGAYSLIKERICFPPEAEI